jgi:RNA polymerase sigma-70 factor (ECF subfamily)
MSDPPAFDDFVRVEWPGIVRSLRLIAGDDGAEDVAQDAFARAYSRWTKIGAYDKPGAWVRRVAIRDAVRERKRRARGRELEAAAAVTVEPGSALDLVAALRTLSPQQRVCIVLRYLEGYENVEIAELLGCAATTVGVHLHRAKLRLAVALQEVIDDARQ